MTTMRHPSEEADDVAVALGTVGRLWLAGVDVDWKALAPEERRRRVPLPTYPFEHQPHFIAPGEVTAPKPSLDRRADPGSWLWRPSWARRTLTASLPGEAAGTWLVLHDADGVGAGIARRLRALGARVVSVRPATGYAGDGRGA